MVNVVKIADKLKRLRNNTGLSQEEVSKSIGIRQNSLAQYENGCRIPRDEIKLKIAEFYEVDVGWLFYD